jgi:hypothetical protein
LALGRRIRPFGCGREYGERRPGWVDDHCGRHGLIGRGDDGFHEVGKAEVLELLLTVWSLNLAAEQPVERLPRC